MSENYGGEPDGMDTTLDMLNEELEKKEKETEDDKTKFYSDDDELPDLNSDKLVFKEEFQDPKTVTIKKVMVNRYGKPAIVVVGDTEETTGILNINNVLYMQLKQKFGSKPSGWKGQVITFQAERFGKQDRKSGKNLEGWLLNIVQ